MDGLIIRRLERSDALEADPLIRRITVNIVKEDQLVERLRRHADEYSIDLGCFGLQFFAAILYGQVVGIGGLVWYPIPSKGPVGTIIEFAVAKDVEGKKKKDASGRGVADYLMIRLKDFAWGKGLAYINLTTANPRARSFYKKHEFEVKQGLIDGVLYDEQLMILRPRAA